MVTWWSWTTSFTLVFHVSSFISLLNHIWILYRSQQPPIHHAGLHYSLSFYPLFLLSILVNPWLTSPGSWTPKLLIPSCPIHNHSKCVTGIFYLLTGDYVIGDSCLLDKEKPPCQPTPSRAALASARPTIVDRPSNALTGDKKCTSAWP